MIGATLVDFVILYVLLSDNRRRIILYALAIAIGTCAEYFLNPYGYSLTEPWKFGVGPAIIGLIVLLAACCYARGLRWTHTGSFASVGRLGSGWCSRRHFLVLGIQSDNKRTPRAIHSRRAPHSADRIFRLSVGVGCPVLALWFRPPLPHDILRNPSHVCAE